MVSLAIVWMEMKLVQGRVVVVVVVVVEVSTGCAGRMDCSCCPVRDGRITIVVSLGQS